VRSKRAATRGAGESGNLDSLLDTMANVVGILVVLMAVTQLTVNDAFERIRVSETDQAEQIAEELSLAETRVAGIGAIGLTDKLETARLREHIKRLRADPDASRATDQAAAAARLAATKLQIRKLDRKVGEQRAELANLRIHLEQYESVPTPAPTALRLPDPRPAPPGSQPAVFLCRYGRVLYPDLERLQSDFFEVVRRARGLSTAYFRDHDVGNRDLRWQVMNMGGARIARLDWRRPTAGETLEEIRAPDSDFSQALSRYDGQRHYIQFYVWGDSFDVYLEARRQAEARGFSAGWEAYEIGQSLKFARSLASPPTPVD
jgi:hypothetical protein